jgi:hypothetical protein
VDRASLRPTGPTSQLLPLHFSVAALQAGKDGNHVAAFLRKGEDLRIGTELVPKYALDVLEHNAATGDWVWALDVPTVDRSGYKARQVGGGGTVSVADNLLTIGGTYDFVQHQASATDLILLSGLYKSGGHVQVHMLTSTRDWRSLKIGNDWLLEGIKSEDTAKALYCKVTDSMWLLAKERRGARLVQLHGVDPIFIYNKNAFLYNKENKKTK